MRRKKINKNIIRALLAGYLAAFIFILFSFGIHSDPEPEKQEIKLTENTSVSESAEEVRPVIKIYNYSKPSSSLKSIKTEENDEEFVPGPDKLNLAYFFPDGADKSDSINSYAGVIFTDMNALNASYFASYYDLTDTSPLTMAARSGLGAERVMGKYNPEDPYHDKNDPSTWTVNQFKNIKVSFYDGDGNRINGYYDVQEIMSLASVYSYYHDMNDAEAMEEYCNSLFGNAVSAKVSLGEVYYCSGCLNRTAEQEADDAIAEENQQNSDKAKDTENENAETSASYVAVDSSGKPVKETKKSVLDNVVISYGEENQTAEESEPENQTSASETPAAESSSVKNEADNTDPSAVYYNGANGKDDISETPGQAATEKESVNETVKETLKETEASQQASEKQTTSSASDSSVSQSSSENPESAAAADNITPDSGNEDSSDENEDSESYCPGHIDLYVTITIKGIDDKNGLFKADVIGNNKENYNVEWRGWTDEKIKFAKSLYTKDWFENYGLSISSIKTNSPLTEEEIESYLNTLPSDISDKRKKIVEFALNSVGKVPYYWGGKPAGPGYEKNKFYLLIGPDYRGRILKGLDCSGWINWVYWSVTGNSLPGQSTGSLIGCGRKISRADLKPGDIIIRLGDDAHVVMFLCWAQNGNFIGIHESGSITNNVTVSEMTASWPYYRSLAD